MRDLSHVAKAEMKAEEKRATDRLVGIGALAVGIFAAGFTVGVTAPRRDVPLPAENIRWGIPAGKTAEVIGRIEQKPIPCLDDRYPGNLCWDYAFTLEDGSKLHFTSVNPRSRCYNSSSDLERVTRLYESVGFVNGVYQVTITKTGEHRLYGSGFELLVKER